MTRDRYESLKYDGRLYSEIDRLERKNKELENGEIKEL